MSEWNSNTDVWYYGDVNPLASSIINNPPRRGFRAILNVPYERVVWPAFYSKRALVDLVERKGSTKSALFRSLENSGSTLTNEEITALLDSTSLVDFAKSGNGSFFSIMYVEGGQVKYALVQAPIGSDDVLWAKDADHDYREGPTSDKIQFIRSFFLDNDYVTYTAPWVLSYSDWDWHKNTSQVFDVRMDSTTRFKHCIDKLPLCFKEQANITNAYANDTTAAKYVHPKVFYSTSPAYTNRYISCYSDIYGNNYDFPGLQAKTDALYNSTGHTLENINLSGNNGDTVGIPTYSVETQSINYYTLPNGCSTKLSYESQPDASNKPKAGNSLSFKIQHESINNSSSRYMDLYDNPDYNHAGTIVLADYLGNPCLVLEVTMNGIILVIDVTAGAIGSGLEKYIGSIDVLHGKRTKGDNHRLNTYRVYEQTINVVQLHDGRLLIYSTDIKSEKVDASFVSSMEKQQAQDLQKLGKSTILFSIFAGIVGAPSLQNTVIAAGQQMSKAGSTLEARANTNEKALGKVSKGVEGLDNSDTYLTSRPYLVTNVVNWKTSYSWYYYANKYNLNYMTPSILLYETNTKIIFDGMDNMYTTMYNEENKTGITPLNISYTTSNYYTGGKTTVNANPIDRTTSTTIHQYVKAGTIIKHSDTFATITDYANEELTYNGIDLTLATVSATSAVTGKYCSYLAKSNTDYLVSAAEDVLYNPIVYYDLIMNRPRNVKQTYTPVFHDVEIPPNMISALSINRKSISEGRGCNITINLMYPNKDMSDVNWELVSNAAQSSVSTIDIYYDNILIYKGNSILDNTTALKYEALRSGKQVASIDLVYQEDWLQFTKEHTVLIPTDLSAASCVTDGYWYQPSHTTAMRFLLTRIGIVNDADFISYDDTLLPLIGSTPFATQGKQAADTQWFMSIGTPLYTYVNNVMDYSGWMLTSRYAQLGRKVIYANRNIFPTFPDDCRHYFIHDELDEAWIMSEATRLPWSPTKIIGMPTLSKQPPICNKIVMGFWNQYVDARNLVIVERDETSTYDDNFIGSPKTNYVWMPFSLNNSGIKDSNGQYKPTNAGINLAWQIAMRQLYSIRTIEFEAPMNLHLDYGDYVYVGRFGYGVVLSNEIVYGLTIQKSIFKVQLMQTPEMCFFI